jgi:hypothetical protein
MNKKLFLTFILIFCVMVQGWSQLSVLNLQTGTPPTNVLRSIGLSVNQYTQLVNAAGGGYAGWESSAWGFTMWWADRSNSNRLAVENRLERERIPSNRFTMHRQEYFGPASSLRYYEEGELSLSFVHQDATLVASLLAGTYHFLSGNNRYTISFSGNNFIARTPSDVLSGQVEITGRTFTLVGHNSRESWLTEKWEIFSWLIKDPDGDWWERISDTFEPPLNFLQAYGIFIEQVGQMNANLFPQDRFNWNNATETLIFKSRERAFTGTDWGLISSPIAFYKEMEVRFHGREIVSVRWRYVYISADLWFQVGNPSITNPIMSEWFSTAVSNNSVSGTGINAVINTLIHFEMLRVNNTYTFRRGGGSNTTLTVREVGW